MASVARARAICTRPSWWLRWRRPRTQYRRPEQLARFRLRRHVGRADERELGHDHASRSADGEAVLGHGRARRPLLYLLSATWVLQIVSARRLGILQGSVSIQLPQTRQRSSGTRCQARYLLPRLLQIQKGQNRNLRSRQIRDRASQLAE